MLSHKRDVKIARECIHSRGSSDFESLLQINKLWLLKNSYVLSCHLCIKKTKQPNTGIYCMLRCQQKMSTYFTSNCTSFSLCGLLYASCSTLNSLLLWKHVVVIPLFTQITNYVSFWRNSTSSHFAACVLIATHLWVSRQTRQAFEAVHPCWGVWEGSEISTAQVPNDGKSVRATCCTFENTTCENIWCIQSLLFASP